MISWLTQKAVGVNLADTPGFLYAISYSVTAIIYCYAYPHQRKQKKIFAAILTVMIALALFVLMTLTKGSADLVFLIAMVLAFVLSLMIVVVNCDVSVYEAVYGESAAFILGELNASLEWQILYFLLQRGVVELTPITQTVSMLIVTAVIGTVGYLLFSICHHGEILPVARGDAAAVFLIALTAYAFSNMSYLDVLTPFSAVSTFDVFIVRTLTDLAGFAILIAFHLLRKNAYMRQEMMALDTMLQMQYSNYQISEESIELVNQKYHDLKHQIAYLKSTVSNAAKSEALNQMEAEIRQYEAQNKTGNDVLDTILTGKKLLCQKLGITMTVVADGAAMNFMKPIDICSVFGNAMDNAIESVQKIEDPEKRLIHVAVTREKNFLRIRVENCYEGKLNLYHGKLMTTKRDSRFHGFGMKSIHSIVEKYHGSVTIGTENGWFELRILIPVGEMEEKKAG